jgi:hypothetical protein
VRKIPPFPQRVASLWAITASLMTEKKRQKERKKLQKTSEHIQSVNISGKDYYNIIIIIIITATATVYLCIYLFLLVIIGSNLFS